jgi:hypothetical protein
MRRVFLYRSGQLVANEGSGRVGMVQTLSHTWPASGAKVVYF